MQLVMRLPPSQVNQNDPNDELYPRAVNMEDFKKLPPRASRARLLDILHAHFEPVQGPGFRFSGLDFRGQDSGLRAWGLAFGGLPDTLRAHLEPVQGPEFQISGFELRGQD